MQALTFTSCYLDVFALQMRQRSIRADPVIVSRISIVQSPDIQTFADQAHMHIR